jgi:predicted metal-dependent hydrolase
MNKRVSFLVKIPCYNFSIVVYMRPMEDTEPKFIVTPEEITRACEGDLPSLVRSGLEMFNRGEYFAAHELLEEAWRSEPGPVRELYRGILQIAVAYYHLLRGNYTGASKMFLRSRTWLDPFAARCCGIDLDGFRQDYGLVEKQLLRLGPDRIRHFDRSLLKPIRFVR